MGFKSDHREETNETLIHEGSGALEMKLDVGQTAAIIVQSHIVVERGLFEHCSPSWCKTLRQGSSFAPDGFHSFKHYDLGALSPQTWGIHAQGSPVCSTENVPGVGAGLAV